MKKPIYFILVLCFCMAIKACNKDKKLEKKAAKHYIGTWKVDSYELTEYQLDGSVKSTLSKQNIGVVDLKEGTDHNSLSSLNYKWTIGSFLMQKIEQPAGTKIEPDGSKTCYWVPDMADKRMLIRGGVDDGSIYTEATVEHIDKNRDRWTYVRANSKWDGGDGTNAILELKEVYLLSRQ